MRRRKTLAPRQPCGKVRREPEALSPSLVRRIRQEAVRGAADPRLGTPFGLMFVTNEISEAQFFAGLRFAELRAQAVRALDSPPRTPAAMDIDRVGGRAIEKPEDQEEVRSAIRRYCAACSTISRKALRAIEAIVCDDSVPAGHEQKLDLVAGLAALVLHFRIDERSPRV